MKTYELMEVTDTYALGVEELRKIGQKPLTFKETVKARVDSYNKGSKSLFLKWNDTCTGIAYKKGTTKFKIIPSCKELINIKSDLKDNFLPCDYSKIEGNEFDSSIDGYDRKVWVYLLGEELFKKYETIIHKERITTFPKLWVRSNTDKDELRALYLNFLNYNSDAVGSSNLNVSGSFLRVAPSSVKKVTKTHKGKCCKCMGVLKNEIRYRFE